MGWINDVTDEVGLTGGSYDNPSNSSQTYLDKIPGYVDQYYQPYINMGQEAGNIAQGQYAQMAGNPTQYYNDIYSTYEPSDYYKYQSDMLGDTQTNAAASGGYAGTETDVNNQMTTQNALLNQDWNQYLNQVLGIQGTGLGGEQQMYNTGYNASNQAFNGMNNYAMASAGNQYKGTQNKNAYNAQQQQAMNNAIMSGLSLF